MGKTIREKKKNYFGKILLVTDDVNSVISYQRPLQLKAAKGWSQNFASNI